MLLALTEEMEIQMDLIKVFNIFFTDFISIPMPSFSSLIAKPLPICCCPSTIYVSGALHLFMFVGMKKAQLVTLNSRLCKVKKKKHHVTVKWYLPPVLACSTSPATLVLSTRFIDFMHRQEKVHSVLSFFQSLIWTQ